MTKSFIDQLIHHMKLGNMVVKTSPWLIEGIGEKQMNIRYVGLRMHGDWLDIFSEKDNVLVKFIYDKTSATLEYYLANNTPFHFISKVPFSAKDKWEKLLGELKRTLKRDKSDYLRKKDLLGNLYTSIKPHLK